MFVKTSYCNEVVLKVSMMTTVTHLEKCLVV